MGRMSVKSVTPQSSSSVTALLERSNRLGSDPRNTNYAGGNTSAKGTGIDPATGMPVELLWVKGSGSDLATMRELDFTGLRLDGIVLVRHQLQIETHAGLAPLPRRLDLPLGRRVSVHVITGEPLGVGMHSLEADITVPGVASGRLVIEGTVGS